MTPDDILDQVAKWLPLVILFATLVNAFTGHYSKHRSLVRAFLHIAERLSFLTSKDVRTKAGRLKLPLQDAKPK